MTMRELLKMVSAWTIIVAKEYTLEDLAIAEGRDHRPLDEYMNWEVVKAWASETEPDTLVIEVR